MWEVINAYVIMHNMMIESECNAPANDDHPFDFRGPLIEVEQVSVQFAALFKMHD
jgi:hypothetical protein